MIYVLIGHFVPTDESEMPENIGLLDALLQMKFFASLEDAQQAALWYPDARIFEFSVDVL